MVRCPVMDETHECVLEEGHAGAHQQERQDRDLTPAASEAARERRQQRAALADRALRLADQVEHSPSTSTDQRTVRLLRELAAAVDPTIDASASEARSARADALLGEAIDGAELARVREEAHEQGRLAGVDQGIDHVVGLLREDAAARHEVASALEQVADILARKGKPAPTPEVP